MTRARQYGSSHDGSTKAYKLIRSLQPQMQKRIYHKLSIKDPNPPDAKQYGKIIAFLEEDSQMEESLAMLNNSDFSAVQPTTTFIASPVRSST